MSTQAVKNGALKKTKETFEDRLAVLEDISNKLKAADTDLDTSVKLYEKGIQLARELEKELSEYERRVEELSNPEQMEAVSQIQSDDIELDDNSFNESFDTNFSF